jgi:hypothetical protein
VLKFKQHLNEALIGRKPVLPGPMDYSVRADRVLSCIADTYKVEVRVTTSYSTTPPHQKAASEEAKRALSFYFFEEMLVKFDAIRVALYEGDTHTALSICAEARKEILE